MDHGLEITVPFRDVDMHGHLHNAVHLAYFESAINHFIRSRNLSVYFRPDGPFTYYVRKAEVAFHAPTRFEDDVILDCRPVHLGRTSLRFGGAMTGKISNDLRATAEIVWICVDRKNGKPVPMPDTVRAALVAVVPAKPES
jgi:acyl-CoA thioester hydrolase